uniref:arsenate-mycothiol transferase ArsC n=1 Tax=Gelidibacter sp. TaxID=2018083 RepID=UPI004049FDDB
MLYPEITTVINHLDTNSVSESRQKTLQPLIDYVKFKVSDKQNVRLNFICTHNSRRSHLSQVWAQAMAAYFNIPNVVAYSGGTEATALFPMAAKTLEASGFKINVIAEGQNPIYSIKYDDNAHPIIGFSKTYDSEFNPTSGFCAIMTCSQADGGCPFIAGAEKRVPITYDDPKAFDHTPQQAEKYMERSLQIATELKYVFEKVKSA